MPACLSKKCVFFIFSLLHNLESLIYSAAHINKLFSLNLNIRIAIKKAHTSTISNNSKANVHCFDFFFVCAYQNPFSQWKKMSAKAALCHLMQKHLLLPNSMHLNLHIIIPCSIIKRTSHLLLHDPASAQFKRGLMNSCCDL